MRLADNGLLICCAVAPVDSQTTAAMARCFPGRKADGRFAGPDKGKQVRVTGRVNPGRDARLQLEISGSDTGVHRKPHCVVPLFVFQVPLQRQGTRRRVVHPVAGR